MVGGGAWWEVGSALTVKILLHPRPQNVVRFSTRKKLNPTRFS